MKTMHLRLFHSVPKFVVLACALFSSVGIVESQAQATRGLLNLSLRHAVGTGAAVLTGTFTVEGTEPKQILIRGLGPTLGSPPFSLPGTLADPQLEVSDMTGVSVASNDDWGSASNAAEIVAVSSQVGAFSIPSDSKDAAVLGTFAPGTYTIKMSGVGGGTGQGLLEILDTDTIPRLVYLSVHTQVDSENNILGAVFVVGGPTARQYLIRAVGAASLFASGALGNPHLEISSGLTSVATNEDWINTPDLVAATETAGAQPLTENSNDAALLVTLDPGSYSAWVSGTGGSSGLARLDIFEIDAQRAATMAPAIVSHPTSVTVTAGQPATFGVNAVGKPQVTYQWRRNASPRSGATGATYAIPSTQIGDAGDYDVVVTNASGTATSSVATLTVNPAGAPPTISTQPHNQTIDSGQTATLTVVASGTAPLSYQWYRGASGDTTQPIAGANGASYTTPALTVTSVLWVRVANDGGPADSATATVNVGVHAPPSITSISAPRQILSPGQSLNLSATANGTGTLVFQWSHNGKTSVSAIGSNLPLSNVTYQESGYYYVDVSDDYGTTRSAPIFVIVAPPLTQVFAWGFNFQGQANVPAGLSNVITLAAGSQHSLALKSDGTVVGWGNNSGGESSIPAGLNNVVAIAAGGYHSLALKSDGTVVAWGGNNDGESNVPTGLNNVVAIAAGTYHSLALRSDGTTVAWGWNLKGQTTVPAGLSNVIAIAAGTDHSLSLKRDGTIFVWGGDSYGQATVPPGLNNVAAIAGGDRHTLVLKGDGTVVAWGGTVLGEAIVPTGLSNVVAISAGVQYSLALKSDGNAVAWGRNDYGQASVPAELSNVVAIVAGGNHSVVLHNAAGDTLPSISIHPATQAGVEDSSVTLSVTASSGTSFLGYQWRKAGTPITDANQSTLTLGNLVLADAGSYDVIVSNWLGSVTSNPATLTINPVPVVTSLSLKRQVLIPGQTLNLSVTATGTGPLRYQWARNGHPIVGAISNSLSLPNVSWQDGGYYVVHVTDDYGTRRAPIFVTVAPALTQLRGWGMNFAGQTTIPAGLSDAVAVAAGEDHSLALRTDGTVIAWGGEDRGLDLGPVAAPAGLGNVVAVAAGYFFSVALKSDGTAVAWGTSYSTSVPAGLSNVVAIAAGSEHTLALRADGTVTGWGHNLYGELSIPTGLSSVVAIAAGGHFSLALKSDGTVVAWGLNEYGQVSVPAGLNGVVAIAAAGNFSLALKNDGTFVAWGDSRAGQTTVPVGLSDVIGIATGSGHTLALRSNGVVVAWGPVSPITIVPSGLSNVFAIAAGWGHSLALRGAASVTPPSISSQPVSRAAIGGTPVAFSVNATGDGPLTYQWKLNGVELAGATSATYTLPSVQRFHAGSYSVIVRGDGGWSVLSSAATLTVAPPAANNARLLNLSTRAQALTGDDVLIPGFVIAGTGNKRLLIRAVGPTLGKPPFGLAGVLPDPRMRLLKRNPVTTVFEEIAANDNWATNSNVAAITQTAADLFAFGFNDALESALLLDLIPGEYTVTASGVNDVTGLAIVELYDADPSTGSGQAPASRLVNISNRGFAGVGDQVMIPGFVVSSEGPKTLLVRVVGPTLGGFGVPGTMVDPKLTVYSGQTILLENDNWGDNPDAATTTQIAAQLFAFPLTSGSKDAAFVVTLPPGGYTVVGSSADAGGTGIVLVEVYVVP